MKFRFGILLLAILLLTGCAKRAPAPMTMDAPATVPADDSPDAANVEEAPEERYESITVARRKDGQTVLERALVSPEETEQAQGILFDYLVKSAVWEGVDTSELADCVILSFDRENGADRQCYYQYTVEGRPVLQAGERGMYSIMSDGAYEQLTRLSGVGADTAVSPRQAEALLAEQLGEKDAATGNAYSFGYIGPLAQNGKDYYRFRLSWLVDGDHLSYLTDYLVALDGGTLTEYIPEEQTMQQTAYRSITAGEAKAIIDAGTDAVILDVRTREEFAKAHIPGAVLIPDSEIASRAPAELPDKSRQILVYCRSGRRSAAAAKALLEMGYTNVLDFGGINDWPYETVTD